MSLSMFSHTIPLPLDGAAVARSLCGSADAACDSLLDCSLLLPVDSLLLAELSGAEAVTIGLIFSICACATPAFLRSSTDEYGRLATIFLIVAGPMPGSESSSFSDAVFRSTFADDVCCCA